MTRQLLLLRHAKSSWDDPSLADHERPISKRGRKAASAMGAAMLARGLAPDTALVSTARRARETFAALGPWSYSPNVTFLESLYHATAPEMLELLRETAAPVRSLLLVGHNPGLMELAILLAGADRSPLARRLASGYPTGALARFELEGQWREIGAGSARLADFAVPRELPKV